MGQKNQKSYKKQYDAEYYKKNKLYASFRAIKCRLYKNYSPEIAETMLLAYLLKQKAKGYDIDSFINKIKKAA